MIKIENIHVVGWEPAIRGMRNPKNSWDRSDSCVCPGSKEFDDCKSNNQCCPRNYDEFKEPAFCVGENDLDLMKRLIHGGTEHRKFLRMIQIYMDITASQTWWAEFDTYKVGTVRNSCSKMHKIHVKEFCKDDFDHEGIDEIGGSALEAFERILYELEWLRVKFNATHEKRYWRAMIELLPMGYHLRATVMINYEVALTQIKQRKGHKLDEWDVYIATLMEAPYMPIFLYSSMAKVIRLGEE